MIAHEDHVTGEQLAAFLRALGIEVASAQVLADEDVDLNVDGLVTICGPKNSPSIRTAIGADPHYDYVPDADGRWRIIEVVNGVEFVSPLDRTTPAERDLGYLGRLPRPDGRGSFVAIAGIHAIGSLGVVDFLTKPDNLLELHRAVDGDCFSTVISASFRRMPLGIIDSQALTTPRAHRPATAS